MRDRLEDMRTGELRELVEAVQEILADREPDSMLREDSAREVVERRKGRGGRWLQREMVKCGKPHCSRDRDGAGHGPYWYLYYTSGRTSRYTSKYIGRELPDDLKEEFREPAV